MASAAKELPLTNGRLAQDGIRRVAAKNRDEWFYRTRFEQSGEDRWLLEYGRSPSAWKSPWFRRVVRTKVMTFIICCTSRNISLGQIAKWLNEHGPSPSKGAAWHKSTLRYLLDRSPDSGEDVKIKTVMRFLKGLRRVETNQQPWKDQIIEASESSEEKARRVWEMHRLLLPPFRSLSADLARSQREHEEVAIASNSTAPQSNEEGHSAFGFSGLHRCQRRA